VLKAFSWIAICTSLFAPSLTLAQRSSIADLVELLQADWSPPRVQDNRWEAISSGIVQLEALGSPTVALKLAADPLSKFGAAEIRSVAERELTRSSINQNISIRDISLTFGEQQISLAISIDYSDANLAVRARAVQRSL